MKRLMVKAALSALLFAPIAATAEDVALLVGNASYDTHRGVPGAARVLDLAPDLRQAGYEVISFADLSRDEARRRLPAAVDRVKQADRLLVVIAGQVVTSPRDSHLLLRDATAVDAFTVGADGLSIGALMDAASLRGDMAVVAVSDGRRPATLTSGVTDGFEPKAMPAGITVIAGTPVSLTRFLEDEVLAPGVRLDTALQRAPADLQVYADGPMGAMVTGTPPASAFEESLWQLALAENSVVGYQTYLNRFPTGRYAAQADAALLRLTDTPENRAERMEANLALDAEDRRAFQDYLRMLGYYWGEIDGIFGSGTRAAISDWQFDNGFVESGYLNAAQVTRLVQQGEVRAAALQVEADRRRAEVERRDRLYWQDTGAGRDEAGLQAYLHRFPQGLYADIARARLQDFADQAARQAARRDRRAWATAEATGTLDAYQTYLAAFPNGEQAATAHGRISQLQAAARPERVCIQHSAQGASGINEQPWRCTSPGQDSDVIWLGDDTGWRDQKLRILSDKGRACFQHQRVGGSELEDTGWICAGSEQASAYAVIGNDTGYHDQKLRVLWEGSGSLCVTHRRRSETSGWTSVPWQCSSGGTASGWIPLGDDTGWRDQQLQLSLRKKEGLRPGSEIARIIIVMLRF